MTHRDELRRICRVEPDDGPFVRELKAVLAPADLVAEVVAKPALEQAVRAWREAVAEATAVEALTAATTNGDRTV